MIRGRMTPDFAPDPVLYPFQSRWFEGPSGRIRPDVPGHGRGVC